MATPVRPAEELESLLARGTSRLEPHMVALVRAVVDRLTGGTAPINATEAALAEAIQGVLVEAGMMGGRRVLLLADRMGGRKVMVQDALPRDFAFGPQDFAGTLPRVVPTDAVKDLLAREPRLAGTARDVARIYGEGHSFALARASTDVVVDRVQRVIGAAMQAGFDVPTAADLVAGLGDFTRGYAEMVYRTNTAGAYTAGMFREAADPDVRKVIAALRFSATRDADVRPNHLAADGIIAAVDDPVWHAIAPPLGYNCFAAGTPVLTPSGPRPIEFIGVGDYVVTHRGRSMRVLKRHATTYTGPVVELAREGWDPCVVTWGHRLLTSDGRWIPARELVVGSHVADGAEIVFYGALPYSDHPYPASEAAAASLRYLTERGVYAGTIAAASVREANEGYAVNLAVYNLTVDEDSSYIAAGFVASNCRCAVELVPADEVPPSLVRPDGTLRPATLPAGAHADPGFGGRRSGIARAIGL